MKVWRVAPALAVTAALIGQPLKAQDTAAVRLRGDSLVVRFAEAELRAVIQALGRHLDRPVLFGDIPEVRVTLETPQPVPISGLLELLRGLVETHRLELVADSAFYRVQQREQPAGRVEPGPRVQAGAPELFVVRLSHARAADVAATLNALYGRGGDLGGGAVPGTLSEELRRQRVPPAEAEPAPPGLRPERAGARAAVLESEIVIVPDPVTNALLIRATPHDAQLLQQAIQELDLRPLQVLIEVLIVEVRRDRLFDWGLDVFVPEGTGKPRSEVRLQGGGLGDFVLRVMDLSSREIDAVLRAGASRGAVEIVSRPVILASNNQEARILVGSQRPFIQVSRSLPTDAPTRDQVVQFKDVGTRLTVRPTISADGYVTLDVLQEVNSATTETAFDAPVISTREAATQLVVRDSQTIVIGGLVDKQKDVTSGGIPLLSEIPVLGGLFGRQARRSLGTELFLFLTPRILRTDEDIEARTRELLERAPGEVGR